jgi:glycosyltransferase involved in cell wall biosynthesis
MICLLHGYLLEGSGSNLWTRSVIQALCRTGQTVHLVCQEPHPEAYDFISEAHIYHMDGRVETRLSRAVPYPGSCIMHKPQLGDTLPVYVWDKYDEYPRVVPMVDLTDDEIEAYLRCNEVVVRNVVRSHGITVMQANHVVLMSVVAQRISAETGIPYVVMPHGSALEYAVKPDSRFHAYAAGALANATRVLVSAEELGQRVLDVFPNLPGLREKIAEVRVGVDTSAFQPVVRAERPQNIEHVAELLAPLSRGRSPEAGAAMMDRLAQDRSPRAVAEAIAAAAKYDGKLPDVGAEDQLRAVDWVDGQVLIFVGRVIVAKGIHCIIAALPEILLRYPDAQLVIAGHGPLREPLEALLYALRTGDRRLAEWLAAGDPGEDRLVSERMDGVPEYWHKLEAEGRLDRYYAAAAKALRPESVRFVGYLTHRELSWIFPCCDVGIFPSMVKESGPMVFLEALSSGCFPIGTYFAGTRGKIDSVAPYLGANDVEWMKLRPEPAHLASDLARVVPGAIAVRDQYADTLRRVAEEEYDWKPIAAKLARTLHVVAQEAAVAGTAQG